MYKTFFWGEVCCCCCCCSHVNSHNQLCGHRTGSSHSGAEEYPREKNTNKPKVVHAYITADAFHASARNIYKVKSGVSLRCARSILVNTSHYSRLEKPWGSDRINVRLWHRTAPLPLYTHNGLRYRGKNLSAHRW